VVVKKGWYLGGRKWFFRLDRNRVAALVYNVHLIDHGWLYQNSRFHPLPPALKTRRFTPSKPQCDAVPKLIDSGEGLKKRGATGELQRDSSAGACSRGSQVLKVLP
jgi:hypothetical protein